MMPMFVSLNVALAPVKSREANAGSLERCAKSHHALILASGNHTILPANFARIVISPLGVNTVIGILGMILPKKIKRGR
jgi:hypothetical protein